MGPKGAHRHTELEVIQALKKLKFATSREIGLELNLSHKWIEDKLRILKQAGRIYIADYRKVKLQGPPREVYGFKIQGDEEDAMRPPRLSDSQKTTNWRKRKQLKELLNGISQEKCSSNLP
jgi:hypothetical protein